MPDKNLAERITPLLRRITPVLAPALVVFLIYYPAIHLGLVWDDRFMFDRVPFYSDPHFFLDAIRNPLILFPNFYRPLAVLSFLSQAYIFGVNPKVFHLTSVLIHSANTALVALIAARLAPEMAPKQNRHLLALGAGLLYGLHPALIESTTFISMRYDLLLTFFLLLALLADISLRRPWLRATAVALAFLSAALCKELALAFPLALPLWFQARNPQPLLPLRSHLRALSRDGHLQVYVAVIVSGLIYLALRKLAMGYIIQAGADPIPFSLTPLSHLLLVAYTLTSYLGLILLPFGQLAPAHPLPIPFLVFEPGYWIRLGLIIFLVLAVLFLLRRRVRSAYLLAAALVSLLPLSSIVPLPRPVGAYFSEGDLTFPMTLFTLASVFLLAQAYGHLQARDSQLIRRGSLVIVVIWMSASAIAIRQTVPLWNSGLSLWTWAAEAEPSSSRALANLISDYISRGRYAQAYATVQRLLALPGASPEERSVAWYALASMAFNSGHIKTAIRMIDRAAKHAANLSEIGSVRAAYLNYDGQYREAAAQARLTLAQQPFQSFAHIELGLALIGMGEYKDAVAQLRYGARIETNADRKRVAERNLRLATNAWKRQQRGLPVHIAPQM